MGNGIVTLLSDFGVSDAYVGVMKGVILGINPAATIVDISHEIEPHNVLQAAYVLSNAYCYFPRGTIHLVVIDPGVGSHRKAIIVRTPEAFFVAPDNGVLSYVAEERIEIVNITNSDFWLSPVSSTFHGRDVFAPVAAYLSLSTPACDFGEIASSMVMLSEYQPWVEADGTILGRVIHIDRFGNLITNVRGSDLIGGDLRINVKNRSIEGISSSYFEGDELLAIIGSDGHLEIAFRNGNASVLLGIECGEIVKIIPG